MLNGAFVERDIPNGTVVNGFAMDGMTLSGVVTDGIIMNGNYSDIEDAYNHGNVTIAGVPDFETEQEMAFWIIQRSRRLLDAKCEIVRLQISRQYPHWIASIAKAHNILSEDTCALCIIRFSARTTYKKFGSCCDEHKRLLKIWFMGRDHN
ncbi:hypothetical protein FPQ18DRAFT_345773 [Pyronema domesticum]|nr:hypothetical protein FPQ18DRAFT_345773 [Pyronema domesticum]